jgi:uncharacterized membrane protein
MVIFDLLIPVEGWHIGIAKFVCFSIVSFIIIWVSAAWLCRVWQLTDDIEQNIYYSYFVVLLCYALIEIGFSVAMVLYYRSADIDLKWTIPYFLIGAICLLFAWYFRQKISEKETER